MSFKILSPVQKVLKRPARVIGDIKTTEHQKFTFSESIKNENINYNPGLGKIIREIIDNSIDEFIRTNGEFSDKIDIQISDDGYISVKDNGRGIPIKMTHDHEGREILIPEAAWTRIDAGSNFDDDEKNQTAGQNGEGAALTNIFSVDFKGETTNTESKSQTFTLHCTNNLSTTKTEVKETKKPNGTIVKFLPDYQRFGVKELPKGNIDVLNFELLHIGMTYPGIKFTINGKKLQVRNLKEYASLYNKTNELSDSDGLKLVVMPSSSDSFEFIHFINGLNVFNGGTPMNWVTDNIVNRIHEKLVKKYKSITKGDIKSKLFIVSIFNGMYNPRFADQIKSQCVNNFTDFKSQIEVPDFDKLVARILKCNEIMDTITEVYKIKEELKKRQELKNADKQTNKKPKSEKFMPPIGEWTNIFLAEGDCLEENTDILMANGLTKKLKEVNVGDFIISGDGSIQRVKCKVKSMRKSFKIKTKYGDISCSGKHRFYVYDSKENNFIFIDAESLSKDINRYKMLKNRINETTQYIEIIQNDASNKIMKYQDGEVYYTTNDFFVVFRTNKYLRIYGEEIIGGDLLTINS